MHTGESASSSEMISSNGLIDVVLEDDAHRRVKPLAGVNFASLFDGYDTPGLGQSSAWPDDDMVGAERI